MIVCDCESCRNYDIDYYNSLMQDQNQNQNNKVLSQNLKDTPSSKLIEFSGKENKNPLHVSTKTSLSFKERGIIQKGSVLQNKGKGKSVTKANSDNFTLTRSYYYTKRKSKEINFNTFPPKGNNNKH